MASGVVSAQWLSRVVLPNPGPATTQVRRRSASAASSRCSRAGRPIVDGWSGLRPVTLPPLSRTCARQPTSWRASCTVDRRNRSTTWRRRRHHRAGVAAWLPTPTRGTTWGDRRTTHRLPHLPAVRGGLRARDHAGRHERRHAGHPHPRRPRRRVQPRASSAPRARRSSSSTRTPTGCAGRWSSATARFVEVELGRGVRRGRAPARCRSLEAHGRDAVGRLRRQPERPQPRRAALPAPAPPGARHARTCSRPARSTSGRRRWRRGADVRRRRSPSRCPTSTAPTSC